jgi:hypothetical protein
MNRKSNRILLSAVLFGFGVVLQSLAELKLGDMTMVVMEAQPLQSPLHLSRGAIYRQNSLASVGGVAFELEALPADSLNVQSLAFLYDSERADGNRLSVIIDTQRIFIPLFDWQLIPIARYADSRYCACFTYFGALKNKQQEGKVIAQGGKIVNYHPAIQNTLLGLRLMQSDLLLLYNECADLPKQGGTYVLGKGESEPDLWKNRDGQNNVILTLQQIELDLQTKFRSYLISDFNQNIRFSFKNDTLSISGNPFYYCWRYAFEDMKETEQLNYQKTVRAQLNREMREAQSLLKNEFNEKNWYIDTLLVELKRYSEGYSIFSEGTVVDVLKLKSDEARRNYLNRYYTSSLGDLIIQLRYNMAMHEPIYLKEYSERLSADPERLRGMNPAVWDATTNTMRYAAFFRYCKSYFPDRWNDLLKEIAGTPVEPKVATPTVLLK